MRYDPGVQSKSIPAGHIPVSIRPGLLGDSGVLASELNNMMYYGVEWDLANSDPACTRIGSMDLHRTLPIQSGMYACLLNDDRTENYKLHPSDWSQKKTGGASALDGTDGQVKIYRPGFYFRHEEDVTVRRWKISPYPVNGFTWIPPQYVGAYEASLDRVNNKLASVINTSDDYRGGNNNASYDGTDHDLHGMPVSNLSRGSFRSYAHNRGSGWEMYNYWAHRALMILFTVEYATRYSQMAVNSALDASGFRQGGLGAGCTNINATTWNTWNAYNPFIPCGYTNELASGSGEVLFDMPEGYGTLTTQANRYRGVENPFGHIWKNCDGINVRVYAADAATPITEAFVCDDPSLWNDSNYDGYYKIGELPRSNGYIKEMIAGQVMPLVASGAGDSTYWTDHFYTLVQASGDPELRRVMLGGSASYGSSAGFSYSDTHYAPWIANPSIGSRLCCFPA